MQLAIAGAGIGGLTAALALAKRGIRVTVFERRQQLSEDGAGIQIGPNGMRILRDLGVDKLLDARAGKPQFLLVRDGRSSQTIAKLPLGEWMEQRHGAPYWVAHRADLQGALEVAVLEQPLIDLRLGARVSGFEDCGSVVSVHLDEADDFSCDALIVADGIWSSLRAAVTGESGGPRFCGKSAARTLLDASRLPAELSRSDTTIWLARDAHVVHYPVRAGAALAIVVITKDADASRDWSSKVAGSWALGAVKEFAPVLSEAMSQAVEWRKWGLHEVPLPATLARGRVALLGDAAHPVLPFLAQGGVLAIEDAAVLARHLAGAGDVPAALQAYGKVRRARAARVRSASNRNGEIYHLHGAMAAARNAAMSLAPPQRLISTYDWLYGWRDDA